MEKRKYFSLLRNILADLYPLPEDSRRISQDVGLNLGRINFSGMAISTWQSILEEANKQNCIIEIVKIAHSEYPENEFISLASMNSLSGIISSDLPQKEWQGPRNESDLEKIIGKGSTLRDITFLERGLEISQSIARVVLEDGSLGTGFLTENNIFITNNHVISSKDEARKTYIEFNYQNDLSGSLKQISKYSLDPDTLFSTSIIEEYQGNDWTAVKVKGNPNEKWGKIMLNKQILTKDDEVIIIQHPGGGPKQIALSHNIVVFVNETRIQYLTDTMEGSSGSPVFNTNWDIVGLHHKGGWLKEPGTTKSFYRNQGIHINALINDLETSGIIDRKL